MADNKALQLLASGNERVSSWIHRILLRINTSLYAKRIVSTMFSEKTVSSHIFRQI